MTDKNIAIIGCGNLGLSIVNGLLNTPGIDATKITVTKRNTESLVHLQDSGITITTDNVAAAKKANIIILALKPYNILDVVQEISSALSEDKILVSLATGISIADLQAIIPSDIPLFRAMPNTAADVGTSMTCICTNNDNDEASKLVKQCFDSIGSTIRISENLMDSATVLGACGIAYVLRFMRAMVQGGIQIGFDSKTASEIVNQTVNGAAQLLIKGNEHPEFEIDKVTTPKGCTIAGLNEMEHNGFSSALIKGIVTSYEAIDK